MSEFSSSGSSGLSERWTLVSELGEVEGSDTDSSSSSIEVVQQDPDPASQCSSVESTELEKLMKKADADAAAAAEMKETELSESVTSGIGNTPVASVNDHLSPPLSALEEPSGTARSQLTGEEQAETRASPTQPAPERASFSHRGSHTDGASHTDKASDRERASQVDQASQTDQASSVLPDRRFSLSSLWSFSFKSSSADTTSDSDASSATSSTDADTEEEGSSIDTDTDIEPEFVCLETEATSSCPSSREGSMLRSRVKAISDESRSSVGSEFVFLPGNEDFAPASVNADLELLPLADQEQDVQQDHHRLQHKQQQSCPESLTPTELPPCEEQQQPSTYRCQEQGYAGKLHHRDLTAEANTHALITWPQHGRHHSTSYFRRRLGRPVSLAVGMFLVVFLAFGLGHWMGTRWTQSRQLRKAQNEHRECMSEYHHLQQQADAALKREKKKHKETVTDLRDQQQRLSKRLKEAEHRVEKLKTASETSQKESKKRDKRSGTASEDSEYQTRSDMWHHLYFSMRDERDIRMNGSEYLHYFTRRVNTSALLHHLMLYWNVSRSWTESVMADLSSGLSGLQESVSQTVPLVWRRMSSQVQENVAEIVPSMWKAMSSLSHTYHAFASSFYQSADSQHGKVDTKQKRKTGENRGTEESDEEVYVENEKDFYSQEYNDWEGEKEEHDENVDAGNNVWTDEEDENIDIDTVEQMGTEYEEESKTKDETQDGYKHRKKWSSIMNKLLKKTKKALSRVGKRLQKTWRKIKDTSQHLWSENSAPRRMAEQVKDSISRLSSRLQKKAQRWFGKHFKEKKHSEAFQKRDKKETDASSQQNGKKSDSQHAETGHVMSEELHKKEKNKQKFDKDRNSKDKSEKDTRDRKVERKSDKFVKADMKESVPKKIIKDQKKDHPDNLSEKKKERTVKERNSEKKKETPTELDSNGKNEGTVVKPSKFNKETIREDSSKKQNKRDRKRKFDEMNKEYETIDKMDINKKKRKSDTLSKIRKERSDKMSNIGKKGEEFPAHHSSLSNTAVARTKFRLQSQFQEFFSKVSSMNTDAFRQWSNREVSKMADDLRTFAKRYNSKVHLGLPVSGSRWLRCQHAFWVSAVSHHGDNELIQNCFQFLAPWQITLLEEEGVESFSSEEIQEESILVENENDGDDWTFLTHEDHDNVDFVDFSVDEVDFADDCHINPDTNGDEESDHRTKDFLVSKGQREEDENASILTSAQISQQSPRKANSQWYTHRAEGRNNLRTEDHKADWMFERAKERDEARQEQHKADWVFERAAERDANRHKESSQSKRKSKTREEFSQP